MPFQRKLISDVLIAIASTGKSQWLHDSQEISYVFRLNGSLFLDSHMSMTKLIVNPTNLVALFPKIMSLEGIL